MRPKHVKEVRRGLLMAAGLWTEEDRKRCRDFVSEPAGATPPPGKGLVNGPRPVDLDDRIARATADAAANAPAKEPIACWGGCGKELGNGCRPYVHGWHSRPIDTGPGTKDIEAYCPDCFERFGWTIGEGGRMRTEKEDRGGRAAVQDSLDTAKYARLRDNHITVECADCACVLLADKHAAEVAKHPDDLPPLAAGTITLKGGRVLRFCAKCIETHVIKRDNHTAGGGDRRADKPLLDVDASRAEEAT